MNASRIIRITPSGLRGECQVGFRNMDAARSQGQIDYALYKGPHYQVLSAAGGTRSRYQPVNPTQQMVRTLASFLAPNAPLADVSPRHIDLEFEAELRTMIYDQQAEELRLNDVYQDAVIDALLRGVAHTLTLVKSGGDTYAAGNHALDMGKETTRLIDLDDLAYDPMMKGFGGSKRFIAHRYPIDREDAMEGIADGCYGALPEDYDDNQLPNPNIATPEEAAEIIQGLNAIENYPRRGDRVDDNEGEFYAGSDRLGETVMLWDVVMYLPGGCWIITLPADPGMSFPFPAGAPDKFLACYKWEGPASGPINALSFLRVPFNKMPLSLAQMQRDLAEVLDILANKTFRQLLATKNAVVYNPAAENMAMALRKSENGSFVRGNPNDVKNIQTGGLVPEMMPGTQYFRDEWQHATANIALASGNQDSGKGTATAFEGLMSRVQGMLDFMRAQVEQLATDDLRVRAAFLDKNPMFKMRLQKSIGQGASAIGLAMTVQNAQAQGIQMTPQMMQQAAGQQQGAGGMPGQPPMGQPGMYTFQGTAADFDLKTRAFSMAYANPQVQAQAVMKALSETIPAALQAGLDPKPTLNILSRLLNEPELTQIIPDPITLQMQQQEAALADAMSMDPTGSGQDDNYQQDGPTGKRLPGKQRAQSPGRAMNPGPGNGSPRPMTVAMTGAAA